MRAIRVEQHGGPDVLQLQQVEKPSPRAGELLVKVEAAGVNFIDVYHRTNLYPTKPPFTPGTEAAGTVAELGPEVTDFTVGDRIAYAMQIGAYAEYTVVPAAKVVPLPDAVDLQTAAAALLQGMTAHYLTHSTYPIQPGDRVLVHAAAGGAGSLVVQMAKRLGARVFGTVSTEEKAAVAREAGADEVILYTKSDFESEVKRLTDGHGVDVVYDSVGKTTFDKGLNCLRPRGYMVLFGQSSGIVPPFDLNILNGKGSLFVTRPSLGHYIARREELLLRAGNLFDAIAAGEIRVHVGGTFPLVEAEEAHRTLEGRRSTGKLLLLP